MDCEDKEFLRQRWKENGITMDTEAKLIERLQDWRKGVLDDYLFDASVDPRLMIRVLRGALRDIDYLLAENKRLDKMAYLRIPLPWRKKK